MFGKRKPKSPDAYHAFSAQELREARGEIDRLLDQIETRTVEKENAEFCLSNMLSHIAKAWHYWDMSFADFDQYLNSSDEDHDIMAWHRYAIPNLCPFQFSLVHPEATYHTKGEFPPVG